MDAKVAIIIANYNYGHFLFDGIESIKQQTYDGPLRIYLVDVCSSENSWEKISEITEEVAS